MDNGVEVIIRMSKEVIFLFKVCITLDLKCDVLFFTDVFLIKECSCERKKCLTKYFKSWFIEIHLNAAERFFFFFRNV